MDHAAQAAETFEPLRAFLVDLRWELRLTRAELARRIGCQAKQLESWEKPPHDPRKVVPTMYWVALWAQALGCSLTILRDKETA